MNPAYLRPAFRLGLGLFLSSGLSAAALAGGHGPVAPTIVRPAISAPAAPGPKVVQFGAKPVYGPPTHAIYGPPRGQRHALRHRGQGGFIGYPGFYAPAVEGGLAQGQAPAPADYIRPRAQVVTVYNGAPPLWQGDAGYVAQPVIYNVDTVLRRYPLTGGETRVVK